jgi:adenosylhomocysteine nucleosidase
MKNIPFISVKYVTDKIGENSIKHWEDKLADAREGLNSFLNNLSLV